jgi:hypothetical protein
MSGRIVARARARPIDHAIGRLLLIASVAFGLADRAEAGAVAVDLELVLAVDASASVDEREFALQLGGIAKALRDPEVQSAIAAGPLGRIAVAMVVWAEGMVPKQYTEWQVVAGADDAEAFAVVVETFERRISGGTGIGAGIVSAIRHMDRNGIEGARRVVDVSGDGTETPPRDQLVSLLPQARSMAIARGVTVNGLAILTDVPDLDVYYREEVIVGPRAFVKAAADFDDFAEAFRRKLIREIEEEPPVSRRRWQDRSAMTELRP